MVLSLEEKEAFSMSLVMALTVIIIIVVVIVGEISGSREKRRGLGGD